MLHCIKGNKVLYCSSDEGMTSNTRVDPILLILDSRWSQNKDRTHQHHHKGKADIEMVVNTHVHKCV